MITIVRGNARRLHSHFTAFRSTHDVLWLARQPGPLRSWDALRGLYTQLEQRLGRQLVDSVLARDAAAAVTVAARFLDRLDPRTKARRATLTVDLDAHLTHNWWLQRRLYEALADLLAQGLAGQKIPLAAASLHLVDRQSLCVVRLAYQRHGERMPPLRLGYEPGVPSLFSPRGMLLEPGWSDLQRTLANFQSLAGSETIDLESTDTDSTSRNAEPLGLVPEGAYDALESRATEVLEAAKIDNAGRILAVEAVRESFANIGFGAALRLALRLLERCSEHAIELEAEEAADIHAVLALACHNRQFKTQHAGPELVAMMEHHLRRALKYERRPARRCALLYRLSVNLGRRQKRFDDALKPASLAVAESAALPPREAAYQEAWALNIRAFLHMRCSDTATAERDMARALDLLARVRNGQGEDIDSSLDRWPRDIAFSQAVVAHNASNLQTYLGRPSKARHLRLLANDIDADFDGIDTLEAFHWAETFRQAGHLDRSMEYARRGLESAVREHDAWSEYCYLAVVADLDYRRGQPAIAAESFAKARDLRSRLGEPEYLTPLDLPYAAALGRAGESDGARVLYHRQLEALGSRPDPRALVLGRLGVLEARCGASEAAERHINDAIDAAVESGELLSLMRAACDAGQASQLLGRREDALEAYRQAEELAAGDDRETVPADDWLALRVGLLACGIDDHQQLQQALEAVPHALDDAEIWWLLPQLAGALVKVPEVLDRAPAAVDVLLAALSQRADCAAVLGKLSPRMTAA